jgi:hypothetical protein
MASMGCSGRPSLDGPEDVPITTSSSGQKQIRSRVSSGAGSSISGTGKIAVGDSHTSNAIKSPCINGLEGLHRHAHGHIDMATLTCRIVDLPESEAAGAGRGDIATTNQSLSMKLKLEIALQKELPTTRTF